MIYADLLGKRFRYGGRGPDEYDCYGLVMEIYKRIGVDLPDYGFADNYKGIDAMVQRFAINFKRLSFPVAPCIVAFMIWPPYVSHIGVVLEGDRFLHIMQRSQVSRERLSAPEWASRIAGYYQVREKWTGIA